jgi:hypothetical protein
MKFPQPNSWKTPAACGQCMWLLTCLKKIDPDHRVRKRPYAKVLVVFESYQNYQYCLWKCVWWKFVRKGTTSFCGTVELQEYSVHTTDSAPYIINRPPLKIENKNGKTNTYRTVQPLFWPVRMRRGQWRNSHVQTMRNLAGLVKSGTQIQYFRQATGKITMFVSIPHR